MTLRCYFVQPDPDEPFGISIVASSAREAKKMAWKSTSVDFYDWIDVRVRWQREVDVSGFEAGHIFKPLEGLKIGCYGWVEGIKCEICGKEKCVSYENGIVGCSTCIEKSYENQNLSSETINTTTSYTPSEGLSESVVNELKNFMANQKFFVEILG